MATDPHPTAPDAGCVILPDLKVLAGQAAPRLIEAVIVPLAVFYTALTLIGLNGALAAVIAWVYGNAGWQLIRRRAVSGTMILAMIAITVRTALAVWSGGSPAGPTVLQAVHRGVGPRPSPQRHLSILLVLNPPIGTYLLVRPISVAVIASLAFLGSVQVFRRILRHLQTETVQRCRGGRPRPAS